VPQDLRARAAKVAARRLQLESYMTPLVRDYMSVTPETIGTDQTLSQAHILMRAHGIRHLPVLDGGKLVGIVSQRDLQLIETLKDVDPNEVHVEEAMTPDPFAVRPDTPIDEIADEMATHRYGSAVVVDGERVIGVFTTVDALRALVDLAAPKQSRHARRRKA
jgi:acetoin utilization protein AcuB